MLILTNRHMPHGLYFRPIYFTANPKYVSEGQVKIEKIYFDLVGVLDLTVTTGTLRWYFNA